MSDKKEIDRRQALGLLAATGSAATGLLGCGPGESRAEENLGETTQLLCTGSTHLAEPLAPRLIAGTFAYAEKTLLAGRTLHLRVSSDTPFRVSLVRLGWDTTSPSLDTVINPPLEYAASQKPIRCGSYVQVDAALPAATVMTQMSLECWVRLAPQSRNSWQGLISQYTYPDKCGFGLFVDSSGCPAAYFGNGGDFQASLLSRTQTSIADGRWHHVVAVLNGNVSTIWIDGVMYTLSIGGSVTAGLAPLRLGAYGENAQTSYTLDGDIAMPVIYAEAISEATIVARAKRQLPPSVPAGFNLIGCWPLVEESGTTVGDASGCGRTGRIINDGTWMIGGPSYEPSKAASPTYVPQLDPTRGHGLRLSSEDIFDCKWSVTHTRTLSSDALPGIYAARIEFGAGFSKRYDTTFVVRRAASKTKAPVLVLCNTNTWLAYTVPFPFSPDAIDEWSTGGLGNVAATPPLTAEYGPSANMYAPHAHRVGTTVVGPQFPTYQLGLNMPWGAFPYMTYGQDYGHLIRAERPFHVWLEQNGYDYDVASDFDLDAESSLLSGYKIVVIVGHSEYWTAGAYRAVESYLNAGGKLMVMSGNTMFWRVSFDAQRAVMECRKVPKFTGGFSDSFGEVYHSQDGARGGLMRQAGYPAWRLTGLESVGYDGPAGDFYVTQAEHSFFKTPEPTSVSFYSTLAAAAVRHEYDVTLASLPGGGKPDALPGASPTVLAESNRLVTTDHFYDYSANSSTERGKRSEVIDWQRGPGGRVFAAGAIAVAAKIATSPKLAALLRNVMHQFGVAHRLDFFVRTTNGKIRSKGWNGSDWVATPDGSGWADLGGSLPAAPVVVRWAPNHISMLGVDTAGLVQYRYFDGQSWAAWGDLGGTFRTEPVAAIGWARDRLHVFGRATDNKIYQKYWDGSSWFGWNVLGSTTMLGSPATALLEGRPVVCAIGSDGRLWYTRTTNGTTFGAWSSLGGTNLTGRPVVTAWAGTRLCVFAMDTSGRLFAADFNGGSWGSLRQIGSGLQGTPAVVVRGGNKLSVFAIDTSGQLQATYRDSTGSDFGGWTAMGSGFIGSPAAISWRGEHVSLMATTTSKRLNYKYWDGFTWDPDSGWTDISASLGGSIEQTPQAVAWIGSL
jgi:hypothetical protein